MKLLCSAVDFGFGASGKLDAILDHLPDAEVTFVKSKLGAVIGLNSELHQVTLADELQDFDAAIVVLDPKLASALVDRGMRVIYVDSLPHLWGENDSVCTEVAVYCAQRVAHRDLSSFDALSRVKALVEVGAIIPRAAEPAARTGTALVNVGGVHSSFSDEPPPYSRIVVPPVVKALRSAGFDIRVIGNIDDHTAAMLPPEVEAGPVPHEMVAGLLAASSVLFTSPGLTTLLEAGAARIPTVLLPPQNVSQVLNADEVTATQLAHPARINWPEPLVDIARVRDLARKSEEDALRFIYARIDALAFGAGVDEWLEHECLERMPPSVDWLSDYVEQVGGQGAAQVANIVREVATRSFA